MIKYQYIIGLKGENMTVKKSLTKNKKILKVKFRKRKTIGSQLKPVGSYSILQPAQSSSKK